MYSDGQTGACGVCGGGVGGVPRDGLLGGLTPAYRSGEMCLIAEAPLAGTGRLPRAPIAGVGYPLAAPLPSAAHVMKARATLQEFNPYKLQLSLSWHTTRRVVPGRAGERDVVLRVFVDELINIVDYSCSYAS